MRRVLFALAIASILAPLALAGTEPPYHRFVTRKGWETASWLGEPPSPDMYLEGFLFIDTPGKLYFGIHRTPAAEFEIAYATLHFNATGLGLDNTTLRLDVGDAANAGWIYASIDVPPQPEEKGSYSHETVFHTRNADGTITSQEVNKGLSGTYAVIKDPRTASPPQGSTVIETDEPVVDEGKPFPWLWIILAVAAAALVAAMIMSRKKKDDKKDPGRK